MESQFPLPTSESKYYNLAQAVKGLNTLNPPSLVLAKHIFECSFSQGIKIYHDPDYFYHSPNSITYGPNGLDNCHILTFCLECPPDCPKHDCPNPPDSNYNNILMLGNKIIGSEIVFEEEGAMKFTETESNNVFINRAVNVDLIDRPFYFNFSFHYGTSCEKIGRGCDDPEWFGTFMELESFKIHSCDLPKVFHSITNMMLDIEKRHKEIGRYSLEESASFIAKKSNLGTYEIELQLFCSINQKTLIAYGPAGSPVSTKLQPKFKNRRQALQYEMYWDDLNDWLRIAMPRFDCEFPKPSGDNDSNLTANSYKDSDHFKDILNINAEGIIGKSHQSVCEVEDWDTEVSEQAAFDLPKINMSSKVTDELPGKMPRTAAGKLAIKAAWQIECETKRKTSADKVMERLQEWAKVGNEGELIRSIPHGVIWITIKDRKEKPYRINDCGKHLDNWYKSRI